MRSPPESRVETVQPLEDFRLPGKFVGQLSQRLDPFDEPLLLRLIQREPRPRVPDLRILGDRTRAKPLLVAPSHVFRKSDVRARV
jgi:hypothetical protein